MSLSDVSSNEVNNDTINNPYPFNAYIQALRTEVSLPPPFIGQSQINIAFNPENENEERREQMYEFNHLSNQSNVNDNSLEELIEENNNIFKNIRFNINGVWSNTREEITKEKTKSVKQDKKRKVKIIKNKIRQKKNYSSNSKKEKEKEKEKVKGKQNIKPIFRNERDIKELHQKDFNCIVNNKRKRKSEIKENINISSALKKKTKKKKNNYKINEEIFKSEATFHLHHRKIRKKILKENSKTNKQNNVTIHKFDEDENNGLKTSKILGNIRLKKNDDYPLHFKIERDCIKNIEQLEKNDGLISPLPFLINRKIGK